jgi:hypothetical protein
MVTLVLVNSFSQNIARQSSRVGNHHILGHDASTFCYGCKITLVIHIQIRSLMMHPHAEQVVDVIKWMYSDA